MTFTFINVESEHAKVCSVLDSQCFETDAFDSEMISSLLKTPFVSGLLILSSHEQPMGYSLFSHNHDEGDLLTLAVLPEIQGQGYGQKLLQKTLALAKEKNIKNLFLEVRISNKKAIQLYKKHQAEEIGIRKDYYSVAHTHQKEDALVMRLTF